MTATGASPAADRLPRLLLVGLTVAVLCWSETTCDDIFLIELQADLRQLNADLMAAAGRAAEALAREAEARRALAASKHAAFRATQVRLGMVGQEG